MTSPIELPTMDEIFDTMKKVLKEQHTMDLKTGVTTNGLGEVEGRGDTDLQKYDTSSLEVKPGKKDNWLEAQGDTLDPFIRAIAHALMRNGKSRSHAIAIAIATVKRWAAGGGEVTAKTRAKAVKAVARWEKSKLKAAAK